MATTTIGTIQLIATIDTSQYKAGAKDIERTNDRIESSSDKTSNNINKGFNAIAKVGLAAVAAAAVAAGAAITSNLGNAIRRVDTLNNANRTFENMGFETRQVETSMERLVDSITGLPTPLDSAVRGMQSLSATYGDVEQGQRIFTALNNAILGFGGTAAEVDNAIQQLSQLPMDGPLDAQTWNSLRNSGLTPVLVAMAKDFGLSINEMKEDFGEGKLTVRDFTEALTRMNEEGGGGLKSLEQISRDATSGISTGWANMQTAITRGVANIIERIGSENISRAIAGIGEAFESGLTGVIRAIDLFEEYSDVIRNVAMTIGIFLIPALTRYIALQTVAGVQALIAGGRIAAGWLLALGPIGLIAAAVGAAAALIVSNWDSLREPFEGFLQTLNEIYTNVSQTLVAGFNTVKDSVTSFVNDGIALANSAINSTVGFIQSVIDWFVRYRQWFINIAIVAGTILGPALVRVGAIAVAQAARAAAAWIASGARTTASFIATAAAATVNAVKSGAIWVAQAVVAAAAWLIQLPRIIAQMVVTGVQASINAVIAGAAWVAQAVLVGARWTATFAIMIAGIIRATAQFLLGAARIAAGWLLALGPVGAVVAIVVGVVALIIANWETLQGVFQGVWDFLVGLWGGLVGWFTGLWNGVVNIFSGVPGWFRGIFQGAWSAITGIFGGIVNWFRGIWDGVVSLFGNVGTRVGDAIGGAVKGVVNGILGGATNIINGFIDAINFALDAINAIPGVSIGRLDRLNVPQLADGGVVSSATLAVIGEGSEPEAVIPLSRLDEMLSSSGDERGGRSVTINQENNVYTEVDMRQINRDLTWELRRA